MAWPLERDKHLPAWHTAEGSFLVGGRWSSAGRRVLYTSIDPATTILEVAVHKGFMALDTVPHTLLELRVEPADVHVVQPSDIANLTWLHPGTVSIDQQKFGDDLLDDHALVVVPSVVSTRSWNLLIHVRNAAGLFALKHQESFALGPRLTQA